MTFLGGYDIRDMVKSQYLIEGAFMKLTKKHIGQFVSITGSDGSWAYLLLDIQKDMALFISIPWGKLEIEKHIASDWEIYSINDFLPVSGKYSNWYATNVIEEGWKTGRITDTLQYK